MARSGTNMHMACCVSHDRSRSPVRLGFAATALMLLLGGGACDTRPSTTSTQPVAACPAVECKCACPAPGGTATSTTAPPPPTTATSTPPTSESVREETEELSYQIGRKLGRKDPTCAADLARIAEIAPRAYGRMGYARGQCLLVNGKCDEGAKLLHAEWTDTAGMSPAMVERSVESIVITSCTGKLDDRREMLRALSKLQEGGYQTNIGIRACTNAINTVARLKMKVKPKDDEDHQVLTVGDVLPMAAASCLARAGDCKSAWAQFQEHYSGAHLAEIKDPAIKATTLRATFEAVADKCKGK
jgi:hypothetical protein